MIGDPTGRDAWEPLTREQIEQNFKDYSARRKIPTSSEYPL